jgi:hypothetical protein
MKNTLCAIAMLGAVACANAPGQTLLYNESTPGSSYYNPSVPTTIVFDDVPIPTSRLGGNTWVSVQTVTVGIFQAAYAPATYVDVYWTTMTTTVTPPDTQIDTPPTLIGTVLLPANGGAWTITPVTLSTPLWNLAVPLNLSIYAGYGTFSIGVRLSSTAWNVGWMLGAGPDANWDGFWQYDPNANPPETVWWFSGNPFAAFYISVVGTPFTPPSACCFSNGSCQMLVPGVCTLIGGISLAYPSTCTPNNPCPQPGACCVAATGECYMSTITAPGDCDPNDTYWGDGSTCTPNNPCPQPPPGGACCYPDGSCAVTTQADCTGAWLGAGTTCSPADRCQWPDAGACCHPNGSCNMTLEPACTTSGGTWLGSESNCSPNLCEEGSGSIRTWGDCSWPWYQCLVPEPNSNFVAVAAGFAHSLGLKADGSIVGWGLNSDGQCSVPSPNSNFVAVAAGAYHSLGLKADGSIVAWGWNSNGQCDVPASNSGFRAIAGGGIHSLGLKANGSIVAWGYNGSGECNVPYLNAGFVAVAAGGDSSCGGQSLGLKANGTIVAWGYNGAGQCNVPEPNTGFVAIAAAVADSLGLKDDGSIVAWGWYLTSVPQPNTGFVAVCAGSRAAHCFGLRADGSIVAWGWNDYGQCNVPEPNVGFVAATGGVWHSLGLLNPQPPKGACCQPDGSCSVTTQAACTGVWQGAGTTCSPNPCPQPNGACCLSDGVCLPDISESECLAQSGIWQGPGSTCDPNPCLPAQLTVPATANIFGAGHAVPPAPGGGGGGVLPTVYYLPPGAGRVLTFSGIAGAVACCGEDPWMGPDGRRGSATNISSWQGISGIVHGAAQLFLVGVFLGDSEPVDPAPPRLDCTVDNFLVLAPQIAQTFYIGDGLTGTGSG